MTDNHGEAGPRVLVVGGGLGGLCLAQGLHRAGMDVAVFERDASPVFRGQGYRISLKETGAQALRACLPAHLFDLAVATSIRPATRMIFMDTRLSPRFAKPVPYREPGPTGIGVNRLTLREILLADLDGIVHFGKTFHHYEQTAAGRIRIHFTDTTSATGDLLVGADGTHSAVRRQLIPDATIDELGWVIYGKTPLTPRLLTATPPELIDSFNRVTDTDGAAISIATCRTLHPVAEATAIHAPGLMLTDIPGYFSWTLSTGGPPPATASPDALHHLAATTVTDWNPAIARILAHADVAATFLLTITSARRVDPWDASTVTLLGDAIHTMSPGRGDGANIALYDAHLLRNALTSPLPLATAKRDYERQLLDYGFAAVDASRDHPFAPRKPAHGD